MAARQRKAYRNGGEWRGENGGSSGMAAMAAASASWHRNGENRCIIKHQRHQWAAAKQISSGGAINSAAS
jgi:hypothetical protein